MHGLHTAKGSDIEAKVKGTKCQVSISVSILCQVFRRDGLHHDENKHPVKVLQPLSRRQTVACPMFAGLLFCHVDVMGTQLRWTLVMINETRVKVNMVHET